MKVFLSWSGNRSRAIAEVFKGWLPSVLQAVRPYFSPDDVTKGARWLTEISKELEESRFALLIITPENQKAPWLLFEAGALSKNLDRSKVCPLLFAGMGPADVDGPLAQFQGAQFSKDEMKKVLKAINTELSDAALASDVLDKVFEMWWPGLERQIEEKLKELDKSVGDVKRSERDLLEEILALMRKTVLVDPKYEKVKREEELWHLRSILEESTKERQVLLIKLEELANERRMFEANLRQSESERLLERASTAVASKESINNART